MHPDKNAGMFTSVTVKTTTTEKAEEKKNTNLKSIMVIAYFGEVPMGTEEFTCSTRLDHILEKMLVKYGRVARFVFDVPPADVNNK